VKLLHWLRLPGLMGIVACNAMFTMLALSKNKLQPTILKANGNGRSNFVDPAIYSTFRVLKSEVAHAAKDFDDDTFVSFNFFPPIGVVHNSAYDCPYIINETDWDSLLSAQLEDSDRVTVKKVELLQEVGFIEFFRHHYPRSFELQDNDEELSSEYIADVIKSMQLSETNNIPGTEEVKPRFYFPICSVIQDYDKHRFGSDRLTLASSAILRLQKVAYKKRIFYIEAHPLTSPGHPLKEVLHNAMTLRIDQTVSGSYNDVMIPISSTPNVCGHYEHYQNSTKTVLLLGSGNPRSLRYPKLRDNLRIIFSKYLNETEQQDIKIGQRPYHDYEVLFSQSNFCFVTPGDTTATMQATRAMCGGCVPIFIADDFRQLPFANILDYSTFSLRLHTIDIVHNIESEAGQKKTVIEFYHQLKEMVANGTYDELKHNVEIARDFFNYHRFGSRSPYGAALVSMYQTNVAES